MMQRVPQEKYPWWVRFTFYAGGRSHSGQLIYIGLSVLSAIVCAGVILFVDLRESTRLLFGAGTIGFVVSAVWCILSIRWIDRNGAWPQ